MAPRKTDAPAEWTESQREKLLELVKEQEHRAWLRDILKRWSQWVAAVALGVTVAWDALTRLIKYLGGL